MPFQSVHAARVENPDKFEKDSFRTKEIAPGIGIVMGKMTGGDSMTAQSYRFDAEKFTADEAKAWMKEHHIEMTGFEAAASMHSTLTEKPKFDNGVWIPFLKDGQLAEDNAGKQYRLTKSAIDAGYKSYIGGFININHQEKIRGKIADVRRDGEFAYFKPEGLDEEALAVINSAAYRGVSQQSINLSSEVKQDGYIDVLGLKGTGVAIALYPKTPGCPMEDGCGIPDFSLSTQNLNSQIKSTGGTNTNMADEPDGADALKSITAERDVLKHQVEAMTAEMGKLRSTISDPDKKIANLEKTIEQLTANNAMTIKSALDDHRRQLEAEIEHKQEYDVVVSQLRSIMKKDVLERILSSKPTLEVLKSNLEVLRASGLATRVGAGVGDLDLKSTEQIKTNLQKLGIPMIEFVSGRGD